MKCHYRTVPLFQTETLLISNSLRSSNLYPALKNEEYQGFLRFETTMTLPIYAPWCSLLFISET
jgi:hypothetical protein